jgi:hypothetical protein
MSTPTRSTRAVLFTDVEEDEEGPGGLQSATHRGSLARAYRSQDRESTCLSLNFPMRTLPREKVRIKPMERISQRIIVPRGKQQIRSKEAPGTSS